VKAPVQVTTSNPRDRRSNRSCPDPLFRVAVVGTALRASHYALMKPTLVVGFDRRPQSMAAVFVASGLAEQLEADIHIVHAVDLSDYPVDPESSDWEERGERALEHEHLALREVMAGRGISWFYRLCNGDPAAALIREADSTDALMIVVGNRGEGIRTVVERLISPSVTHRLVNRSLRPVLVVGPSVSVASGGLWS
jgi:nucleotide-binding universal stress UspA family protein